MSVGEKCHYTVLEDGWEEVLDLVCVQVVGAFLLAICVIEIKVLILDILSDSIDFNLRLMDHNLRIRTGDHINLTTPRLLLKQWSLTDTYTDAHL